MIKVSVIVPIYGVEKYIERCVRSLFEQTMKEDIEFIFVNDCTEDNSITVLNSVLKEYPERNSQVRIFHHEQNRGLPQARKTGILAAKGEYIAHCDSDDWVDTDMYRAMYEKAVEESADAVVCDFNIADGETILRTIQGCNTTEKEMFIEQVLFHNSSWALWNKMFKRETGYKANIIYPKNNMGEDFALTCQLLLNINKMAYVPLPLYNYYYNSGSITRVVTEDKKMANFRMNKANADIVYNIFYNKGLNERYSQALVFNKWYVKERLWNTKFDSKKRKLWKETYNEINKKIIMNIHIRLKDKVKFILSYLCLYP